MNISALNAAIGYGPDAVAKSSDQDASPMAEPAQQFAAMFDRLDQSVEGFATGAIDSQTVVEALAETEMALQAAITVRDRVIGAYQELLRMPL